jgi:hypothetical protein
MKFQKFSYFCGSFLPWILDPNPDPDSEYGSGSTDLIESGSNPDPDPKPWKNGHEIHQKKRIYFAIVHTVGFYLAGERAGQPREPGICHTGGGQGAG